MAIFNFIHTLVVIHLCALLVREQVIRDRPVFDFGKSI